MRTVPGATDHVVVVGAGLSGLSAALQLAGRGRSVTVVERYPFPGGRMGQSDIRGYRIDTGPTVLTMPDIIEEAFAAVGASMDEHLDLALVDPAYRATFADGTALDVHTEAVVTEALQRVLAGVTAVVVAHRASTVLLADKVALLDGGTVTHIGTHADLLAQGGLYATLYEEQFTRGARAEASAPAR